MIKIRAKHGPHVVVIDGFLSDSLEIAFHIGRSALNDAYGLKLSDMDGVSLELLGH